MKIDKMHNMKMMVWRNYRTILTNLVYSLRGSDYNDIKKSTKKRLTLPHAGIGVIIADSAIIGNNVIIYPNVVIVSKNRLTPVIEDDVVIYPNSCIVGNVRIGRGAIVGAGSVVLCDVEAGCIVAGNPARIIKKDKNKLSLKKSEKK